MNVQIDVLREKLNELVKNNADFQQIYDVSVKLDTLIVYHYKPMINKDNKLRTCKD